MNKKQIKEDSPYFKYFQTLFETLKTNNKNNKFNENKPKESDYSKKSEEFSSYINDFLKKQLHKKN
ncbi:MAG: hypothetical protein GTO02_11615 [Candidatus Dadabacteria bacterium]|nr:hypothetical protein [Candidatus Dadabacteria bacterium]NIQ15003.1 hypothetical protein [Candidatus Dadabacteria bacterium]